jgi:hypothetical protein
MLADKEWNTPHWSPGGKSVAEWVEGVRWFERNGWLKDPRHRPMAPGTDPAVLRQQETSQRLCHSLCWRPRCKRAGRCRHIIPLAVREWQPEFGIVLKELLNLPNEYHGPHDAVKLAEFKRLMGLPRDHVP